MQRQEEIVETVYSRMYKNFVKELFKGCLKENNSGSTQWGSLGKSEQKSSRRKKNKPRQSLTKEQFFF